MAEISYWFREIPDKKRYPTFVGSDAYDIAIIGGGIAGISAAYFLSYSGLKVALLEKDSLCSGDSGSTTAFATHFLDSAPASVLLWNASEAGIQLLKKTAAIEKIACNWEDVDGIGFTRKDDLSECIEAVDAYRRVDSSIEYFESWDASRMVGFPVRAAYRKKKGEGQFHVRKFLLGLAERAAFADAAIFEQSEVVVVEPGAKSVIHTKNGSLTTDRLIVATGKPPKNLFPAASDNLKATATFVIQASYPKQKPFGRSLFWDDENPHHYFRWVNDTDLILGGEDREIKEDPLASQPHLALTKWLQSIYNADFTVVNQWQGTLFSAPDTIPLIGPRPEYGPNIIFLTGWGGHGVAHGFLSGKIICDIIQGRENICQELFSYGCGFRS